MTTGTWESIVQRAVLGTERAAAKDAIAIEGDLGAVLTRIDTGESERALLASAAILAGYQSAGSLPRRVTITGVEPAPPEKDDQPVAPAGAAALLGKMLAEINDEALPEWLDGVAARGWRVPSPMLAPVLELAARDAMLRERIKKVLGARGRWLAARNPEWSFAADHVPPDESQLRTAWETGTPEVRVAILVYARGRDAALGRALLESTWKEEPPAQRASLLAQLVHGLSAVDEKFLEEALDDRRQEVRRAAADLLRRMPGSALVARLAAEAKRALIWKSGMRKGQWTIEPPAALGDALARDGIEKKPPQGLGERAWWLAQIVAAVPPATWNAVTSAAPSEMIAAAKKSDWWKALHEGWGAAAVRHRDTQWAEAILQAGFFDERPTPIAPGIDELLDVLPPDAREKWVAGVMKNKDNRNIIPVLLVATPHQWSANFAATVIDWLHKRVQETSELGDYALQQLLPQVALRVPPSLTKASQSWPAIEDAGLARALEKFMSILSFRSELAQELAR